MSEPGAPAAAAAQVNSAAPPTPAGPPTAQAPVALPASAPPRPVLPAPTAAPAPPTPAAPDPTPTWSDEAAATLPRVLRVLGGIVAPTTLVTALLFYFGLLQVQGTYRYLRVPAFVLDLTLQDYLVHSVDGIFRPLLLGAGAVVVAIWVHRIADRLVEGERGERFVRWATPVVGLVGLAGVAAAAVGITSPQVYADIPEVPGLLLAIGAVLAAYAARRLRRTPTLVLVEWAALFAIVAVGLFWSVGNYAAAVGTSRGIQVAAELPLAPDAVVYSEQPLSLTVPGVEQSTCTGRYTVRYTGLKLVYRSGDQYLLLPGTWNRRDGAAVLLVRSDAIRLEFSAPGTPQSPVC